MEEKELIKELKKGSKKAYEELFLKYYQLLVVFAVKLVGDMDLARDLVQDVIVSFFEKRSKIDIHTSLKAHLFQSVRNKCFNYLKRDQILRLHHSNIYVQNKSDEEIFNDVLEETELEERIHKVIESLPKQCRKIFELSRFAGNSNQEIADELSISKRTVETQISNALKVLRNKLKNYLGVILLIYSLVEMFW